MKLIPVLLVVLIGCTDLSVLDLRDPLQPLPTRSSASRWDHEQLTGYTSLLEGQLSLETTLPVTVQDCQLLGDDPKACQDADSDGLSDYWERVALHRLRPFVRMHPEEPLFLDYYGSVVAAGRVTPVAFEKIRVFLPLVFSNDYGRCGATEHRGDPERVVIDLLRSSPTRVEVVGVYTASHEGTSLDGSILLRSTDLESLEYEIDEQTDMPRWVIYSSVGKHAMYPSAGACASKGTLLCVNDDCAAAGDSRNDLLPDVYNVGEPDSLDFRFQGAADNDADRAATPSLRPEQVWGTSDYCGDIPDYAVDSYSGSCAGPLRGKFVDDPFASNP